MPKKSLLKKWGCLSLIIFCWLISYNSSAQINQIKGEQYLLGEEKKLEMIVHIWGEVLKPGEYRVSDNTNILELISKAGGATEFSNLREVILTRDRFAGTQLTQADANKVLIANSDNQLQYPAPENLKTGEKRVIKINLKEYLDKENCKPLPKLQPGDVVRIKKNSWFKWQTAIRLASQLALVAHGIYYFSHL